MKFHLCTAEGFIINTFSSIESAELFQALYCNAQTTHIRHEIAA